MNRLKLINVRNVLYLMGGLLVLGYAGVSSGQVKENVDHAGIISEWDDAAYERGEKVYKSMCYVCHGLDGLKTTNPLAFPFAKGKFKNGTDPYKIFVTLTNGFNTMPPQTWMPPEQRYDVIHYLRERFLKKQNPSQYFEVTDAYLKSLPKYDKNAKQVAQNQPREFGPVLGSQLDRLVNNGLTFKLGDEIAMTYDLHKMKMAAVWEGTLDLSQTQHYLQRGERMPKINGKLLSGLQTYQWAYEGKFDYDDSKIPPRGPVPTEWAKYFGHYTYGYQGILSYAVGDRKILEMPGVEKSDKQLVLHHTLEIGAGKDALELCIGKFEGTVGEKRGVMVGDELKLKGEAENIAIINGSLEKFKAPPAKPRFVATPELTAMKMNTGRDFTVYVRFRTTDEGTLFSTAMPEGKWVRDGKALFIRGGRLVYDIGWVGAMRGRTRVNDGKWHEAVLTVKGNHAKLFVDGKLDAQKDEFQRALPKGHVFKVGAAGNDFGGNYSGEIAQIQFVNDAMNDDRAEVVSKGMGVEQLNASYVWKPEEEKKEKPVEEEVDPIGDYLSAVIIGDTEDMRLVVTDDQRIVLHIAPSARKRLIRVLRTSGSGVEQMEAFKGYHAFAKDNELPNLGEMTKGGPRLWTHEITVKGELGKTGRAYELDTIPVPFENPWNAWMRTSALAFYPDGRAVVTTHGGDVWIVSGIDDGLEEVTWRRFASGMFEPFGALVVDNKIYVTTRDGIKRLHDYNGDGQADFYETFYTDLDVSSSFHAYNFDLQRDSKGNLYFAKAGQYTNYHLPGAIIRVPPEGGESEIMALGIRTPNGMGKLPGDVFTVSDNQGPWMPASKITIIKEGGFLGNPPNRRQDKGFLSKRLPDTFDQPFIWMEQDLDSSSGGQVYVDDMRFGPLAGHLLHTSFGKGKFYYLILQEVDGVTQSAIVKLDDYQFDAGIMRPRVNPKDGQVYATGLSGWQGPRGGKDGCLQRLRYTGKPFLMVKDAKVESNGIRVTFNFALDAKHAMRHDAVKIEQWNYLWSAKYGSDHFSVKEKGKKGHDIVRPMKIEISNDMKSMFFKIPDIEPANQVRFELDLRTADGEPFKEKLYFTINKVPAGRQ